MELIGKEKLIKEIRNRQSLLTVLEQPPVPAITLEELEEMRSEIEDYSELDQHDREVVNLTRVNAVINKYIEKAKERE